MQVSRTPWYFHNSHQAWPDVLPIFYHCFSSFIFPYCLFHHPVFYIYPHKPLHRFLKAGLSTSKFKTKK